MEHNDIDQIMKKIEEAAGAGKRKGTNNEEDKDENASDAVVLMVKDYMQAVPQVFSGNAKDGTTPPPVDSQFSQRSRKPKKLLASSSQSSVQNAGAKKYQHH